MTTHVPHSAGVTQNLIQEFGWEQVDHPPYCPDLAFSDCHFFLNLKCDFGRRRFDSVDDSTNGVQQWLSSMAASFFEDGIHKYLEWNFVRAACAVAFSFAPVGSLMAKIKSLAKACKWTFGCHSLDMISFPTRFQNIGPVQEPFAHPCFCDHLTGLRAVWMMAKGSLDVQGDNHRMQFLLLSILYICNQLVDGVANGSALSSRKQNWL
ncbi:hypothetical protein AVEN_223200-1 [Araneus ventricosus]|uniref:Histone-lysine N-methyltransferase SETMAR n=1 Tax=Araneus ventricosus TaxID=182803 RepID=A0A4Y2QPS5_ARAVE|nr:hypothetical protein AVEN_223200-1 [Araneus ventricosus]